MNKAADFRMDLSPFEAERSHASRIAGLGGRQSASDTTYAFRTVPLVVPAGSFDIAIAFDRLQATQGTLLIEIVEGPDVERRQIKLRTVALADLAARGGTEHLSIESDRRGTYSIAGYVHDDTDAVADSMAIQIAASQSTVMAEGTGQPEAMAQVPRLAGLALPSFTHPSSQTWSPSQQVEPTYRVACQALGLDSITTSWSEAYIYQALRYMLGDLSSSKSFAVTTSPSALANVLKLQGAETVVSASVDPAQWPPLAGMDFAWFVSEGPAEDARILVWTALALIDRLRPGGALVMVLPFEHGRMSHEPSDILTRNDIEILGLRLLAQGHGMAQLKFRPANQAFHPGTRTPFGLMLRKLS